MVSTKGNSKGGGPREKGSQQKSHVKSPTIPAPTDPPAGKKATAEQIRMANMIYSDSTDMDNEKIKEQVQQIKELTNRTEDEILVVLYDANYDTEQAINMLLERDESQNKSSDGWVTTSSKKSKLKGHQGSKGHDSLDMDISVGARRPDRERSRGGRDRDKNDFDGGSRSQDTDRRRDRDNSYRGRGRGGRGPLPPRMTRGKGRDGYDGGNRGYRGDRDYGRGRGRRNGEMNGPSRNRGGGGQRSFTNSSYNDHQPVENDAFSAGDNVWRNPPEENWDDVDTTPTPKEDWGAEEWTGDLTHSQVFTASTNEEVGGGVTNISPMDPVQPPTSAPSPTTQPAYISSRAQEGSSGTFGGSEPFQSTSIYSQNPPTVPPQPQNTGMPAMTTRSIDLNELFRGSSSQHQPPQSSLPGVAPKEDNSIFSQFQPYQSPSTLPEPPKPPSQMNDGSIQVQSASLGRAPQMPPSQPTHQPARVQAPAQPKQARKKMPPGSNKFPPSAVEMPLSARGLGGLDVRFGAMDLNIDPAITDYGIVLPGTSLSNNGDLSSGAFSVNDTKSSATSHLSSYKVSDSVYSTDLGSSRGSIPASAPSVSMDATVRSSYGHSQSVTSQNLPPDPIPLPQSSSYLVSQQQKAASNGPVESAGVSTTLPTSPGMPTSVLAPSSGFGLPGNQPLSTSRQAGSYGTPSSAMAATVSSSISSYGAPSMSSGGLPTGLSSSSSGLSGGPPGGLSSSGSLVSGSGSLGGSGGLGSSGTPGSSGSLGGGGAMGGPGGISSHGSLSGSSTLGGTGSLAGSSNLGASGPLGASGSLGVSGSLGSSGTLSGTGSLGVSSTMGPTSGTMGGVNNIGAGGNSMGVSSNSIGGPTSMGSSIAGSTNSMGGYPSTSGSLGGQLPSSSSGGPSGFVSTTTPSTHTSVQTSPLSTTGSKMGPMEGRTATQHGLDATSLGSSVAGSSAINGSSTTTSASSAASANVPAPSSASTAASTGYSTTTPSPLSTTSMSASGSISSSGVKPSSKVPPNLPPGMPFVNPHLIMGGHGLLPVNAYPQFYNIDEMMLQRMQTPVGYPYDLQQFQQLATTLNTGRDPGSTAQYSVTEASKFPRNDAASPVASSLSSQQQQAGGHHQTQAQTQTPFLNPTLPPGYPAAGYGGLPYGGLTYPAPGLIPPGLTYPMFPAVSTVQPPTKTQAGMTPHSGYQQSAFGQPATYGTNTAMKRSYQPFGHPGPQPNPPGAFGTLQGYDDPADFTKGFSSQSQSKGSAVAARGGVSVSSASDVGGTYGSKSHSQTFADKQGAYHNNTPPPFNFPMATATQAGHAGATYPTPFVPLFPPQAHSAMPLHAIPGDTTGSGSSQRPQGSSGQSKGPAGKASYGTYWGN